MREKYKSKVSQNIFPKNETPRKCSQTLWHTSGAFFYFVFTVSKSIHLGTIRMCHAAQTRGSDRIVARTSCANMKKRSFNLGLEDKRSIGSSVCFGTVEGQGCTCLFSGHARRSGARCHSHVHRKRGLRRDDGHGGRIWHRDHKQGSLQQSSLPPCLHLL